MTKAIVRMPDCIADPEHGQMVRRPLERQTYQQKWCGIWYDCLNCGSSILLESEELRKYLQPYRSAS